MGEVIRVFLLLKAEPVESQVYVFWGFEVALGVSEALGVIRYFRVSDLARHHLSRFGVDLGLEGALEVLFHLMFEHGLAGAFEIGQEQKAVSLGLGVVEGFVWGFEVA